MVKYPKVSVFTVLGVALSTILAVLVNMSLGYSFGIFSTLCLLLVCYVISGVVGISIKKGESVGKHSKFFVFITVLGAELVTIYNILTYSTLTGYFSRVLSPTSLGFFIYLVIIAYFFLVIGGPVFLIVGICGLGRNHFKSHRRLFTVLTIALVLFTFAVNNIIWSSIQSSQVGF